MSLDSQSISQTPSLLIRPAIEADYGAIAAIYNEAIAHGGITMDGHPQTSDHIKSTVQKMTDREVILVAVEQEPDPQPIVGWGLVKRYSDRLGYQVCCETSIYLAFSAQGKGYGKQLQTALMKQVRQFGYHHIVAKILAANQGSVRFHQRFGFETVGVQKEIGFMGGTWYDVVIMQCILPDVPLVMPRDDVREDNATNPRVKRRQVKNTLGHP